MDAMTGFETACDLLKGRRVSHLWSCKSASLQTYYASANTGTIEIRLKANEPKPTELPSEIAVTVRIPGERAAELATDVKPIVDLLESTRLEEGKSFDLLGS